jgi:hypothetical protein
MMIIENVEIQDPKGLLLYNTLQGTVTPNSSWSNVHVATVVLPRTRNPAHSSHLPPAEGLCSLLKLVRYAHLEDGKLMRNKSVHLSLHTHTSKITMDHVETFLFSHKQQR